MTTILRFLATAALSTLLCMMGAPAMAQSCSFSISDVNFGTFSTSSNTNVDTTATLTINCTGTSRQRIRICPSIGGGSGGANANGTIRYMLNGANQMNFNLYSNAARTTVWGSYFWSRPPTPPTIDIRLNNAGSFSRTETIYARVFSGQPSLPAGNYSSSYASFHTLIAYADRSVGNCATIGTSNATQAPFNVLAVNVAACSVTANDLDFGSVTLLNGNVDAQTNLSVTCNSGVSYNVGLSNGLTGTGPTTRLMTQGGEDVSYGLYRNNARTLPWGQTIGTNTVAGIGTGAAQSYTVYGRVPPQTTPSAGTYTDSVVVTVTY
jgi:spore coat protein U-like protein